MASGPFFTDLLTLLQSHYAAGEWKVALTNGYIPDLDAHDFWADAQASEIANGNGYTTGGVIVVPTVAFSAPTNLFTVTFPANTWSSATITADGAFYYLNTGSPATSRAGFFNDFGGDVNSTTGDFTVNASTFTIDFPD